MNQSHNELFVVRSCPARNEEQSLPIGNGVLGANVWATPDGAVHLLLCHNAAYSEMGRLSKVGLVHIYPDHEGFQTGDFEQILDTRQGLLDIVAEGSNPLRIRIFCDVHHPIIRIRIDTETPIAASASVELCRPQSRLVPKPGGSIWDFEEGSSFLMAAAYVDEFVVEADHFLEPEGNSVIWCHQNPYSFISRDKKSDTLLPTDDPLFPTVFGASVQGIGWKAESESRLASSESQTRHEILITQLCDAYSELPEWRHDLLVLGSRAKNWDESLSTHRKSWKTACDWSRIAISGNDCGLVAARGYSCQRYLTLCAGRSRWPIRFNGSMFNVSWDVKRQDGGREHFDADYRRWHCGFFAQNTRLIYWPMLMAGDFSLMHAFFQLYLQRLPSALHRGRLLLPQAVEDVAFFHEVLHLYDNTETSVFPQKLTPWRHFTGALEMLRMGIDYHAFTQDRSFLENTLLPLAIPIIAFYRHYGSVDRNGIYHIQCFSLETYHDSVDPAPDIEGLRSVLADLIGLYQNLGGEERLNQWQDFWDALPPTAMRDAAQPLPMLKSRQETFRKWGLDLRCKTAELPTPVFAPAATLRSEAWNVENPDLYGIFPFRTLVQSSHSKQVAVDSFRYRRFQHNQGWAQDPIWAACLGLTADAAEMVSERFSRRHQAASFPAFWEAGFDWIPDQDNGGVASMALQLMLLQWDRQEIHLLPAWPQEWDVDFKLHAPFKTLIEGRVQDGKLTSLVVTPRGKLADITVHRPFVWPQV